MSNCLQGEPHMFVWLFVFLFVCFYTKDIEQEAVYRF